MTDDPAGIAPEGAVQEPGGMFSVVVGAEAESFKIAPFNFRSALRQPLRMARRYPDSPFGSS